MDNKKTILVGMSGGVDSTLCARLLKEQGHNVIGATMNVWDEADRSKLPENMPVAKRDACYGPDAAEEVAQAQALAEKMGIPFYSFNVSEEYSCCVLDYFVAEYSAGRTPNPCVQCNQNIKFGTLMDKARAQGLVFDQFATGHYARLLFDETTARYYIGRAVDERKDQSYFLYGLKQQQLAQCLFPLGNMLKNDVKALASDYGLGLEEKPESQNFINGDYTFLFPDKPIPGDIVDRSGKVLGQHKGIIYYTIGQRKGLGIASTQPLFVLELDSKKNQVIVGLETELFARTCTAKKVNWQRIETLSDVTKVQVKIRYASDLSGATLTPQANGNVLVTFDEPMKAVTPGQSIVFYLDNAVLGGGIIEIL